MCEGSFSVCFCTCLSALYHFLFIYFHFYFGESLVIFVKLVEGTKGETQFIYCSFSCWDGPWFSQVDDVCVGRTPLFFGEFSHPAVRCAGQHVSLKALISLSSRDSHRLWLP